VHCCSLYYCGAALVIESQLGITSRQGNRRTSCCAKTRRTPLKLSGGEHTGFALLHFVSNHSRNLNHPDGSCSGVASCRKNCHLCNHDHTYYVPSTAVMKPTIHTMDTNEKDNAIKQAAASVATSTGTPAAGAVPEQVSSMNAQQDFQKATSTGVPTCYPEDHRHQHQHQQPPLSLEQEWVSPTKNHIGKGKTSSTDAAATKDEAASERRIYQKTSHRTIRKAINVNSCRRFSYKSRHLPRELQGGLTARN
jgi:hypothetical protein